MCGIENNMLDTCGLYFMEFVNGVNSHIQMKLKNLCVCVLGNISDGMNTCELD